VMINNLVPSVVQTVFTRYADICLQEKIFIPEQREEKLTTVWLYKKYRQ
jgi:hypothetical protein